MVITGNDRPFDDIIVVVGRLRDEASGVTAIVATVLIIAIIVILPRAMRMSHTHCYLCGLPLEAPISVDHVAPLLFFPKELRKSNPPA